MNFRTKIPIKKAKCTIDYDSKILSLGSCFAENMGEKLAYFKFQNSVNPFGIVFNPIAIETSISRVVTKKMFTADDVFFYNGLWHCFEVHSGLSHPNKDVFLANLNQLIFTTHQQIKELTHCSITYGTAWVYRNKTSQELVANCHKVPQNHFVKEILTIATIKKAIQNTIDLIQKINSKCRIIFTISPVRHLKDGFVENQRSKAHLIAAIHDTQFLNQLYFPSYEIMMDELRDYRFYAEDMLHPSEIALAYIWESFKETFVSASVFSVMDEVATVQKGLLHKPFQPNTILHQNFLLKLQNQINDIETNHKTIRF